MAEGARCWWCGDDPLYVDYHDNEWGRPQGDDVRLFEKLCLEGFQAGLSWITILRKRENFRRAFEGFRPERVARYGEPEIQRLLADAGIVRHRGKIEAAIGNARRTLEVIDRHGSLAAFLWRFEPDPATRPPRIDRSTVATLVTSLESQAMSKALRKEGFRFVGPTTMYAMMQSVGMVNDHLEDCPGRAPALAARAAFVVPR
ncbi:MAG: DNA-3-methyladenine glycosylase I [Xanthomonadales bacterium]|nr:DNA-3-methyladenine glycosylase I [Xanthomonadales bacterium]